MLNTHRDLENDDRRLERLR